MKTTKTRIITILVEMACSNGAHATDLQTGTFCAGAATLNNGSIVTIGQPFSGLMVAEDNSMSVQVGIVPILAGKVAPTSPLQIEPKKNLSNGLFQMTFATWPGTNYVIQASTNLINWTSIWTNTAQGASLLFEDPNTTNFPRRFYRIVTQ